MVVSRAFEGVQGWRLGLRVAGWRLRLEAEGWRLEAGVSGWPGFGYIRCLNEEVVIRASSRALKPPFWSSGLPLTSWDLLGGSWTSPGASGRRPWSTENDQT